MVFDNPADKMPSLRVALVSMPWALFNRPSIQLGSLKAYLNREADWIEVDAFHPYLEVAAGLGTDVYRWVSGNAWICDALYAPILFPERRAAAKTMVEKALRKARREDASALRGFSFDEALVLLAQQLNDWAAVRDWGSYDLAGFSVCFNQMFSSLAAARILKENYPGLTIIIGGSSCPPGTGDSLLNKFSQLDYVICGEGELPLLNLCEFLTGRRRNLSPQIRTRRNGRMEGEDTGRAGCQLADLSGLPVPDYGGYLKEMKQWFEKEPFIPYLPIEFSRGCWWGKCSFCNLNIQWRGYRAKGAGQVFEEAVAQARRTGSLDFCFTDNVLPVRQSIDFFKRIADLNMDFHFFGEIRATQRGEGLAACRRGGLVRIQAGIEALSDSLLRRLNKGVSVIDNVAVMKDAVDLGINLDGNLIAEFPGSTGAEVEETLLHLDFVFPFQPLSVAAFFLGKGSPVERDPGKFGIRAVISHPHNARLFPADVLKGLDLLIKDYRADRKEQRKLWKPVRDKVKKWRDFHRLRKIEAWERPALSFREGGDYLIIRQERPDSAVLHHRLRGTSRRIYLFCLEVRETGAILKAFPEIGKQKLLPFLDGLVKKRLMFRQDDRYLALAVREGRVKQQPW